MPTATERYKDSPFLASERAAQHADGIIDRMALDPDSEWDRWRAVQEAIRFCAVREGWRLNFVAASGAPYVKGLDGHAITFRDDTCTWECFGGRKGGYTNLVDAVRSLTGLVLAEARREEY